MCVVEWLGWDKQEFHVVSKTIVTWLLASDRAELVSHGQIAFFSLSLGREKKGSLPNDKEKKAVWPCETRAEQLYCRSQAPLIIYGMDLLSQ